MSRWTRDEDREYFEERAAAEDTWAAACADAAIAHRHRQLAEEYRKRARELAEHPPATQI